MTLINRGCQRAARTGAELLDQVKLDAAAERARKALEKKFDRGRMTTKPRSRTAKTAASAKTVAGGPPVRCRSAGPRWSARPWTPGSR